MSQPLSETTVVPPSPAYTVASSGLSPWQKRIVLLMAIVFASLPFVFIGDFEFSGYHLNDLDASGFFFSLGLLPGFIGIAYQVVHAASRREQGREMLHQYYAFRNGRVAVRPQERISPPGDESATDPLGALAASLFLTGIFLLIAVFAGFEANQQHGPAANGVQGMMYAGLGAYVAVLYYMVARLYANALSSRFLLTSALRTASAVVIGWVFGIVGITAIAGTPVSAASVSSNQGLASSGVLFLIGLFHNMAIEGLRKRAVKLFGNAEMETDDVPLTAVDGIDDTTAELLSEYGVSSIQHLATSEPGELCDRTLLPLDRIVDWMSQALLIRYIRRNITVARTAGIRSAIDLALIHMRGETKLLASLAEKISISPEALNHIALELRNDYVLAFLYELQQGKPFPGAVTVQPIAPAAQPMLTVRDPAAPQVTA